MPNCLFLSYQNLQNREEHLMKKYKKHEDKPMVANDPLAAYAKASTNGQLVSPALIDELMGQPDEVKWYIINRLIGSMKHKKGIKAVEKQSSADESESHADAAEWQKKAEAARDYYRQKYNLPESLISLIGCIPPLTDAEREKAKEDYLLEKYGIR